MTKKMTIKDIFGILSLGYGIKKYIIFGGVFFVIGLVLDVLTRGTYFLSPYFYLCGAMFITQIWWTINSFDVVTSSPFRRDAQLKIPTILMTCGNALTVIIASIIRAVFYHPELFLAQAASMIFTAIVMVFISAYSSLAYKDYMKSFIAIIVLAVMVGAGTGFWSGSEAAASGEADSFTDGFMIGLGATGNIFTKWLSNWGDIKYYHIVLIGVVAVILAAVCQYLVALACYKKPVDPKAQGAFMKKYLTK